MSMSKNLSYPVSGEQGSLSGVASDDRPARPVGGPGGQTAAFLGPGFATAGDLAVYLRISPRKVGALAAGKTLSPNPAGRFSWADVWWRLWRVRAVPADMFDMMKNPLLKNSDIADLLGVHERSIRRDGDRHEGRYELPGHLDLSERIRRHHPMRIKMWSQGVSAPTWLQPVPTGQNLALIGRKSQVSG